MIFLPFFLAEVTGEMLRVCTEVRSHKLGAFSPRFNINTVLLQGFEKYLPEDAHERVNGKVHISLTRVYDGKNVIVSHFNSREDLFSALLCACFIPVFSGLLPPRFHGVRYIDGAFSDNLPTIDQNTVTVSPFSGENDICPRDKSSQLFHVSDHIKYTKSVVIKSFLFQVHFSNTSIELSKKNLSRFTHILVPPKGEELAQLCQQGFQDGLRFLQRNNLISCNRCVSIQSSFIVQDAVPDADDDGYDPECLDCTAHRKSASKGNLPDTVVSVLQQAVDSANKGVLSWFFRFRENRQLKEEKALVVSEDQTTDIKPKVHCHQRLVGSVAK